MSITIKDLEQYRLLQKEVKRLAERLERLYNKPSHMVSDSVRASSHQLPYQQRITVITGLGGKHKTTEAKLQRQLAARQQRIADTILAIEDFVDTITQSEIRQIIDYRFIQGLSWQDTSNHVYGHACDATARMAIKRFFAKK